MNRRRRDRKMGIALAGGGPLGGIYEIGALVVLEKALKGVALTGRGSTTCRFARRSRRVRPCQVSSAP
jgi:hypothetical protein